MMFQVFRELRGSRPRRGVWLLLASVGLLTLAACSPSTAPAPGGNSTTPPDTTPPAATGATLVRDGGQVSVAVTWKGSDTGPVFEVAMDTHSVDLDSLDLARLATLKTSAGELSPIGWNAPKGGHHRAGTLTFATTAGDGRSTIGGGPVELVIHDVAGVPERSFQWQP
jgi:hypothetical protein